MVTIRDELNCHLVEGVRRLDTGKEIDLKYVNRLSELYKECNYNVGDRIKFNRILITTLDRLGILEITNCETAEDYLDVIADVMNLNKRYPPELHG